MQLQVDVNNIKSTIFLELLSLFKKDNMINDYKIIDSKTNLKFKGNNPLPKISNGSYI